MIDAQSGLLSELGVVVCTLVQLGHDSGCLGDPSVDLRVDRQRAGDGGSELSEVLNDFPMAMFGGVSGPCAVTLVFFRVMVSPNSLQAWERQVTSCCSPSSVCDVKAESTCLCDFGLGTEKGYVVELAI